jgi:hypothetical protein
VEWRRFISKNHLLSNRILGLKVLRHLQGVTTIKYSRRAPHYLLKRDKTQAPMAMPLSTSFPQALWSMPFTLPQRFRF